MDKSNNIWQMEEIEIEKAVKITEQLKVKYKGINIYPLSGNGTIFGCDDGRTTDRGEKFRCLAGKKLSVLLGLISPVFLLAQTDLVSKVDRVVAGQLQISDLYAPLILNFILMISMNLNLVYEYLRNGSDIWNISKDTAIPPLGFIFC